jgi:hypothetical protein
MLVQVSTQGRILGQLRPANTTAASIYSPPTHLKAEIRKIVVCNTSGSGTTFRIFHSQASTTYDETTALYWDVAIAADTTTSYVEEFWMDGREGGNFAVASGVGNALTFTVYGSAERIK